MITGMHAILYSRPADKLRQLLGEAAPLSS